MASNQKVQEFEPTLKFNFTYEYMKLFVLENISTTHCTLMAN